MLRPHMQAGPGRHAVPVAAAAYCCYTRDYKWRAVVDTADGRHMAVGVAVVYRIDVVDVAALAHISLRVL